jgi:putative peptide zinc metalloprotease protein
MKRLTILLLALLLAFAAPASAPADQGGGGDNAAVAINTKDNNSVFRFAFKIRRVAGDVVDQGNAAVAFASCTDCETSAIAVQVVFATGDPSTVTPQNIALAINENCTRCETYADARQFVLTTDGPVHFTAEGNQTIAEIKQAIRDLKDPALTPFDRDALLDAQMARLQQVIETQLVSAATDTTDAVDETAVTDVPPATVTATAPTATNVETTTGG